VYHLEKPLLKRDVPMSPRVSGDNAAIGRRACQNINLKFVQLQAQ
jgi:hypothetical protein